MAVRKKAVSKKSAPTLIKVNPFKLSVIKLTLNGITSYLSHSWAQDDMDNMLKKQMGEQFDKNPPKDPWRCFAYSLYPMNGNGFPKNEKELKKCAPYGVPVMALKKCAVRAAKTTALDMIDMRTAFHIRGEELLPLLQPGGRPAIPKLRKDMVRLNGKTADIRFRGEFEPWRLDVEVEVDTSSVQVDTIVNLFRKGGFGVGIGDWRPEKDGIHGRFEVAHGKA